MSVPQAYPDPADMPIIPVRPAMTEPPAFRSGPFPGLYPAIDLQESIRLSLLVAAGRIPWPTSYRETP
jgi:hypothetical protein